jgi:hypothetical protein
VTPEPTPRAAPPPVSRPTPDPTAEPLVAMFAPLERRPETRIAISLEDRTALLGFAGTRVAPIRGVLHALSAAGITVGFRREELLPMRSALDGAAVRVSLNLDGRAVLQFAVRMTWVEVDAAAREGAGSADAIFTLDFLAVSPGDLTRIGEAGARPDKGPTTLAA